MFVRVGGILCIYSKKHFIICEDSERKIENNMEDETVASRCSLFGQFNIIWQFNFRRYFRPKTLKRSSRTREGFFLALCRRRTRRGSFHAVVLRLSTQTIIES